MTTENEPSYAFFMPTFNEEKNIRNVVEEVRKHYNGYLFIVDGYSTDNTVKIANELHIDVFKRDVPGKGSAIQKALCVAHEKNIDFVIFFDCDQTYFSKDIKKFLEVAPFSDLVIGVRPPNLIKPFHRRLGNVVATSLINKTLNGNIKDSLSGFKCLRVERFHNQINENGFVADALLCVVALKKKFRISMVNIDYKERSGDSKMGFWIGLVELRKLIYHLFKIV